VERLSALFPRRAAGAHHVDRRDRRHLSGSGGHPSYGPPGGFGDPDGNGVHGLNERRSVASVYIGRDFLSDLVKDYANR
jgi:hypothetical protein